MFKVDCGTIVEDLYVQLVYAIVGKFISSKLYLKLNCFRILSKS